MEDNHNCVVSGSQILDLGLKLNDKFKSDQLMETLTLYFHSLFNSRSLSKHALEIKWPLYTTRFFSARVVSLITTRHLLMHSQRCCCRCRLPSSRRSCRWGHSGTAGNHSVCPSPCRAERHQMAAFLIIKITWLLRRDKNKDNNSVAIFRASPHVF